MPRKNTDWIISPNKRKYVMRKKDFRLSWSQWIDKKREGFLVNKNHKTLTLWWSLANFLTAILNVLDYQLSLCILLDVQSLAAQFTNAVLRTVTSKSMLAYYSLGEMGAWYLAREKVD